ncbi:hypothetical protein HRR83_006676 [Exophiala dermatitidis]|uniref:Uncharacterized protein n=1 Tax=Exophiala dermatitidis TaxID=5970 RepID=A0AAN6EU66_EXODE|nr:hypothetical protein HRR74_005836 [Exophiala dermatitidis]KAJ4515339.1 hypothetical protein HRR73_005170 [Exophiala dermatitidis]KAJ4533826.1 hypothetical protein HRR77_008310 [Exophiala dermatitidis]KAJ4540865.1 hypothetical protein HRR76_004249 [Exophiala dermatitidis]KAJ4560498.1 hypothetical protein HRR79_007906 [Exophiala dermatitidis]
MPLYQMMPSSCFCLCPSLLVLSEVLEFLQYVTLISTGDGDTTLCLAYDAQMLGFPDEQTETVTFRVKKMSYFTKFNSQHYQARRTLVPRGRSDHSTLQV